MNETLDLLTEDRWVGLQPRVAACATARHAILAMMDAAKMGLPDPPGEIFSDALARYDDAVECLIRAVHRITDPAARKAMAVRVGRSSALSNYHALRLLTGYNVRDGAIRDAVCARDWGDDRLLVSPSGELEGEVLEQAGRLAGDRDETADRFGLPFVANVF